MVRRCRVVGVLNDEEVGDWFDFLNTEEAKEKEIERAEKIVYNKANGTISGIKYI